MGAKARILLTLGLAAACASGGTTASDSPIDPVVQVQAAALGYVFQNNDSPLGISAGSYCVGVGSGLLHSDPGPALLRALREYSPKVTRLSACARAASQTQRWQVLDTLSRQPSIAFLVDLPAIEEAGTARVYVEYIQNPTYSTGYDCYLSRTTEGWRVNRCNAGFPR